MKYFWLIVLLLIVLGVLWLRRRGTAGVAPARPTLGDRTPAESVTGAAAAADQGGGPASVFDPVEAPTAVAPATPVAPATAGQPQDQQPRRAAGIEDADEASTTTAPAPVDDAPADVASASQAAPGSAEEHTTGEPEEEEHTTEEPEEEEHTTEQHTTEEPKEENTTEQHTTEQPSWTTSQWDPEHTVAEERGETDRPHFDDDVTEPASADETSEVHEDVFDADHADAAEDTVAASEEPDDTEEVPKSGEAEEAPVSEDTEEVPKSGQAEEAPESEDTEEAPVSGEAEEEGPDAGGAEQPSPSAETDASPRETIDDPALRQRGDWRVGEGEKAQVLTADDASDLGHGSSPDADSADSLDTASPETESPETDSAESPDTESPETESPETDSSSSGEVSGDGPWQRRTSGLEEVRDGGYGVGSAATFQDRAMPLGHPVKAWEDTKSYVTPDHAAYDEAEPHLWFRDADAAQAAGFHPVD